MFTCLVKGTVSNKEYILEIVKLKKMQQKFSKHLRGSDWLTGIGNYSF